MRILPWIPAVGLALAVPLLACSMPSGAKEALETAKNVAGATNDVENLQKELCANVDGIKMAETKYDAEHDGFLPAPEAPRAASALTPEAVDWKADSAEWQSLGWMPDGKVRGVYSVTVSEDGTDFKVKGMGQAVGGVPLCCIATKDQNAAVGPCI